MASDSRTVAPQDAASGLWTRRSFFAASPLLVLAGCGPAPPSQSPIAKHILVSGLAAAVPENFVIFEKSLPHDPKKRTLRNNISEGLMMIYAQSVNDSIATFDQYILGADRLRAGGRLLGEVLGQYFRLPLPSNLLENNRKGQIEIAEVFYGSHADREKWGAARFHLLQAARLWREDFVKKNFSRSIDQYSLNFAIMDMSELWGLSYPETAAAWLTARSTFRTKPEEARPAPDSTDSGGRIKEKGTS
jgi:hypothetical protein